MVSSLTINQRLARLEQIVLRRIHSRDSNRELDYNGSQPEKKRLRFLDLFHRREEGLTDAEATELYARFAECDILATNYADEETDPEAENEEEHARVDGADETNHENETNEEAADEADAADEEYEDDGLEAVEWEPRELAVLIAFHEFARLHPSINLPNLQNLLEEYLLNTASRLLVKYGWVAGHHDCDDVLPLDRWAPEDRWRLETLYRP